MAKHAAALLRLPATVSADPLDRLRRLDPKRAAAIDVLIQYALTEWHAERCAQPVCEWPRCACGGRN